MQVNSRTLARVLTSLAAVIWGTSFVVIRFGLMFLPVFLFLSLRFLVATISFLPLLLVLHKDLKALLSTLRDPRIVFLSFLNMLGFLFQFLGQERTLATNAALLINVNVIFVALISYFILKEKLNYASISGILIAVLGTILLITSGKWSYMFTEHFLGDILCLFAGIFWAFYIVFSKKMLIDTEKDPILIVFAWIFYTSLFTLPLAIIGANHYMILTIGFESLFAIAYTGLFCTTFAFTLWYIGLKNLEATTSSLYLLLEIVFSAILEMAIFNARFELPQLIGACCILIGIILTEKSQEKNNP